MTEHSRGPTQIPLPDLNYIWHGTFLNLPTTTAKISRSYFCFLMINGCHSQTHCLSFLFRLTLQVNVDPTYFKQ